ncbi:D-2-hydroxyacid dehydrogenase [Amnibacterium kyonggiense]|uniref:Phosphoglycerate dehydrogenase-like enzyme n=1 Tax=Amnibacterium kyonggiense TaxID=595671 RepID=A0A4V3EB86_9MICO|nr:D-2-hydroxyacid dehydrogenase [Amnibacterium kyonggiense]TDS80724.1 phosphoglycerate dehydrogenase-like enzyme [Amnibacterium kyonggiense]
MTDRRLRVVAATPLSDELADRIRAAEPRLDLVVEQDLLPPQRHPGDHGGDPDFTRTEEQERRFQERIGSAEVLYGIPGERPSQLAKAIRANPRLAWVQLMPAGGGAQVKAAELTEEELGRVRFTTTAGVHAVPLAEWSEFGLLAGFKTLPQLQEAQRAHEWAESRWVMRRLEGSRVLIVGLGSIGRLVAERLARQGVRVAGTSRRDVEVEGVEEVVRPDDLAARIGDFDGVVVTLPGTDETRHLVSAEVLAAVKPGATVVNVGRGTVIDQDALIEQLRAGRVGFAALDVTDPEPLPADSPLWDLPNVLISPHTAALSEREDALIADLFARNATRYLDGEPLINPVNTREFY